MKKTHTAELTKALIRNIEKELDWLSIEVVSKEEGAGFYLEITNIMTRHKFDTSWVRSRAGLHAQLEGLHFGYTQGQSTERKKVENTITEVTAKAEMRVSAANARATHALNEITRREDAHSYKYSSVEKRVWLRGMLTGLSGTAGCESDKTRGTQIRLYNALVAKAVKAGHLSEEALKTPPTAEVWVINVQYACLLRNEGLI